MKASNMMQYRLNTGSGFQGISYGIVRKDTVQLDQQQRLRISLLSLSCPLRPSLDNRCSRMIDTNRAH